MSDDFKKKLDAYEKGELSGEELEAFELELEKLEEYQQVLSKSDEEPVHVSEDQQRKVMRRGKWKARLSTAFHALLLFMLVTFVTSILSAIYYAWGEPDRSKVYSNIINHTLTITNPYGSKGGGSEVGRYFTYNTKRYLVKTVGTETKKTGEINTKFFFSLMSDPEWEDFGSGSDYRAGFSSPGMLEEPSPGQWQQLEQLPEGTVVSAYVTLTKKMETGEALQLLDGKDIDLLWLAVDTGKELGWRGPYDIIGFPSYPIWHDDDMVVTSRKEEKGFLFGTVLTETSSQSPDYEGDDPKPFHDQFLKTLEFLKSHERKVNRLTFGTLNLTETINYLEKNGVYHYGVVITGPTKEVLKLRKEPWVGYIDIDEVALWNWHNYD